MIQNQDFHTVQHVPMKVLQLGKYYPPHLGGIETHLHDLAEGLQERHVKVKVVVANDYLRTDRSWDNGVEITRVATLGQFASSPLTWGLSREIARAQVDIVHIQAPNPLAMYAFLRSGNKASLVITHQADISGRSFLRRLVSPIWRRSMNRASAIIVSSKTFAEASEELSPFRNKWRIVPMGIDFSFLDEVSDDAVANIRSRFRGKIILFVGRLVPYKGLRYLIKAMEGIDATLLIAGEGPEERELRQLAAPLAEHVQFLGRIPSLGPYYRAADLFVLPSCEAKEAFGLVQLEAMYCGIPVINTSLPTTVPEVSVDNVTGITVSPGNVSQLHRAIASLLSDPIRSNHFSLNATKRAALYSVSTMTNEVLNCYRGVLNDKPTTKVLSSSGKLGRR